MVLAALDLQWVDPLLDKVLQVGSEYAVVARDWYSRDEQLVMVVHTLLLVAAGVKDPDSVAPQVVKPVQVRSEVPVIVVDWYSVLAQGVAAQHWRSLEETASWQM
jgi:hypothetical protein